MANAWDDPLEPERRHPQPKNLSEFGIHPMEAWDDTDLPPEDNEMHVLDLLQRIESENNRGSAPVPAKNRQQPTKWAQWEPEATCPACRYLNSADQKYCGYCGSVLQGKESAPSAARGGAAPPTLQNQASQVTPPAIEQKPATPPPAISPVRAADRDKEVSDLEFLRYKTAGVEESSGRWRLPIAVMVLAIAGYVGYRMYAGLGILPAQLSSHNGSPGIAKPSEESAQTQAPGPAPDAGASQPALEINQTPQRKQRAAVAAAPRSKQPAQLRGDDAGAVTPATQRSREPLAASTGVATTSDAGTVGGREELLQAQRYLSPSSRDTAQAAKWLWKSVGKENRQAVLLLSDLYAKGDGVPKSCDQARLLLTVAAKKGNSDAASRLRSFDSAGCQ